MSIKNSIANLPLRSNKERVRFGKQVLKTIAELKILRKLTINQFMFTIVLIYVSK